VSRLQAELQGTRRVDGGGGGGGGGGDSEREGSTNVEGRITSGDDTGTGGGGSDGRDAGAGEPETEC
jgi:hypothetical protein